MAINPSEPQIPQPGSPVIHWLLKGEPAVLKWWYVGRD